MVKVGTHVKALARSALKTAGFEIINLKHNERYGWDWVRDISRLAPLYARRIETIFDVGANAGQTALELRQQFPDAELHCFEPTPATFKLLSERVGDLQRMHIYPVALGASAGTATLRCFPGTLINTLATDAPFMQRFPDVVASTVGSVEVPVRTIDDVCREQRIERISLLKIDTEGYDLDVLNGARGMLQAGKVDIVVTEITHAAPASVPERGNLVSAIDLLHTYGFQLISTYTDGIAKSLPLYLLSNALFVRAATHDA